MKHSILCVDDEADNVDALERLFRRKYNVLKATSGAEALRVLDQNSVALILTDQRMPGMTGVDLLAKSQTRQPEATRMLLTGYTDIESVIAAINSGQVYRYITKPWDPVDLANAVDKGVERFELSRELREKNASLEHALSELRVLDDAKSNFMILINHELKTPLTAMLSFLDLLRESGLNAEQTKYLTRVGQSADRLRALIEDSLELVSAETGTMSIKAARVNLAKLVEDIAASFDSRLLDKKMKFALEVNAGDVRVDQKALTSVLTRLLDNAIKFGVEKSTITFATESLTGGGVQVSLINQGKSVKADTLARILKPFSLDENIMHHSKGTGLGLSIVQAVLKRLGSELQLESPKGEFRAAFRLPS